MTKFCTLVQILYVGSVCFEFEVDDGDNFEVDEDEGDDENEAAVDALLLEELEGGELRVVMSFGHCKDRSQDRIPDAPQQ